MPVTLAGFYRFVPLADPAAMAERVRQLCVAAAVRGTVLISAEGINASLAGSAGPVRSLVGQLRDLGLVDRHVRFEQLDHVPFGKLVVRNRPEIVTFDAAVNPSAGSGEHVDGARFNELLADPAVRVLDTRNRYETRVGRFDGAEDPDIGSFADFQAYVRRALDPAVDKQVAMYCTGGIRCEKASAWLRAEGFEHVYQLDGGVLAYLDQTAPQDSRWVGDCFVFDQRIAVDAHLRQADWHMCHGCRAPVSALDRQHPDYEAGVSCPACSAGLDDERRQRLRGRARQFG